MSVLGQGAASNAGPSRRSSVGEADHDAASSSVRGMIPIVALVEAISMAVALFAEKRAVLQRRHMWTAPHVSQRVTLSREAAGTIALPT